MSDRPHIIVFCDGSCWPNPGGPGGWAAILRHAVTGEERVLTGGELNSSNNRMELRGAISALASLKRPCDVTMNVDSQYVAQGFNAGWVKKWIANGWMRQVGDDLKPVKNEDLWRELHALTQTHRVTWKWLKGHVKNGTADHEVNDRCDKLALAARLALTDEVG